MQGVRPALVVRRAGVRKKLVLLAHWRRVHAGELRADFRRYYGCSYSEVERSSPVETADIAFFLPNGSALKAAVDPALAWTRAEVLLAHAVNGLSRLGGGKDVVDVPAPRRAPQCAGMEIEEMEKTLSRPRIEVKRG